MPGPGPSAHQVLVYSGPGVSPLSLSHTILTLSLNLVPHYTVQRVSATLLAEEPWEPSCALLVIPGGRDLPFVEELSIKTKVTKRIAEYVSEGGRYLGVCAGAYFAASEVQFDIGGPKQVTGKRDLALFPGPCAGPTYPGFDYGSENGSRAVGLTLAGDKSLELLYYNGGGHFILPPSAGSDVKVLAQYQEPPTPEATVAVVQIAKGKGKVLLSGVHFEYPLEDPPARDAIAKLENPPAQEVIEEEEKKRTQWVAELLRGLGLTLPSDQVDPSGNLGNIEEDHIILHPTHPSPIFSFSHPKLPQLSASILSAPNIQAKLVKGPGDWETLRDGNDVIETGPVELLGSDIPAELMKRRRTKPEFPPVIEELSISDQAVPPQPPNFHALTKTLLVPGSTQYSPSWTPLFNMETYWEELDAVRKRQGRRTGVMRADELSPGKRGERAALGDLVLYAETITSTQTMIDRNPILLNGLPAPTVFTATYQLAGRGRGSNIWLSPTGCLQYSILLTLPQSMASKLVFIQYLAALAICEAVDEDGRLGVRIKWPNDVYANIEGVGGTEVGSGKKGLAKLAGILVNTNFVNGQWRVIVGCGINVLNALPTSSISQLHGLLTERAAREGSTRALPPPPTMEGTFARIMHAFETKWEQFLEDKGFESFMSEYHGRWLHSGQEVTLTTVEPHQRLRIMSITPDHGLLRCIPISTASSTVSSMYDRDMDQGGDDRTSTSSWARPSAQPQYVDLQPDGNSFDLMAGMIKRKV